MTIYWKDEGHDENGIQVGPAWHEVPQQDGSVYLVSVIRDKSGHKLDYRGITSTWVRFPGLYKWCQKKGYKLETV